MIPNNPLDSAPNLHHQLALAHVGTGIAQAAGTFMSLSNFTSHLGEHPVWLTVLWAVMVPAWAFVAVWSFRTARTHRRTATAQAPTITHDTEGSDR